MLFVGIDIAKYDHVIGAVDERGRSLSKPMAFKNSQDGFGRLASFARPGIRRSTSLFGRRSLSSPSATVLSRDLAEIAAENFSYAPYETPLSWENRAGV